MLSALPPKMKHLKGAGALAIGLLPATSIAQDVVTVSIPTCLPGAGVTAFPTGAAGGACGTGPETLVIAVTETSSLGSTVVESLTEVITPGVTPV